MSRNFAAVKPKAFKLPNIIYFAMLCNVISSISLKTYRNKKLHGGHLCTRCITLRNIQHAENNCSIFSTVHLGGGIWGVLSVPIFNKESGIFYARDEHSFRLFGWNLLGVIVIMAWSFTLAFILFITLRVAKQLRVSEEIELKGEYLGNYRLKYAYYYNRTPIDLSPKWPPQIQND